MPRHERQQQQQRSTSIFNRLRNNIQKILSKCKHDNKNDNTKNGNQQFTGKKGRDWRTLSPEFPPLPAVDSPPSSTTANDNTTANFNNNNNINNINNIDNISSSAEHSTSLTEKLSTANNNTISNNTTDPLSTVSSTSFNFSHSYRCQSISATTGVIEGRHLYTIPEEGETLDTSIIRSSTEHYPPPSSVRVSDVSSSSFSVPSSSSVFSNSSNTMYQSPTTWFTEMPDAPHDDMLIGDEVRCQLKLARIVNAASKQQKHDQNARTEILFDDHDNVRSIRIITRHTEDDNKISDEYWRFSGNSQYLPPELPCGVYNQSLADVWVMGIILYRMLVGKYPFNAVNDRKLFSKMMYGDFSIPQQLSDDAKDLLRRMLAPGNARASLDLILFHPWLKPCSSIMLSNSNNNTSDHGETTAASSCGALVTSNTEPLTIAVAKHDQDQEQEQKQISSLPSTPTSILSPSDRHQHEEAFARPIKVNYNSSLHSIKKHIKTTREKERRPVTKSLMRIVYLLTNGPYPPPKQPYRELSLLGRVHSTV
ncbi:hypothetical protein INT45_011452 [Circinella minor]|uniref:Protein kinase domain-containing protein n=1 Tax=Circinella minor TaxID=1195481 RepID=A0A8H7SAH7_9FUNG|nr:hypothetical protein INT45_011452 [Circinella minor]